jgi:hypothetical protein
MTRIVVETAAVVDTEMMIVSVVETAPEIGTEIGTEIATRERVIDTEIEKETENMKESEIVIAIENIAIESMIQIVRIVKDIAKGGEVVRGVTNTTEEMNKTQSV